MRAIAIDDVPSTHLSLINVLGELGTPCTIVGTAINVAEGVQLIREKNPDIIFLDIRLGDETGFDLLTQIEHAKYQIIFITGDALQAKRAMDFGALAYLEKPLDGTKLREALEKAMQWQTFLTYEARIQELERVIDNYKKQQRPEQLNISNAQGLHFVPVEDIIYFRGESDLVTIHYQDKSVSKAARLTTYRKQFADYPNFIQVSKNYLINRKHLVSIGVGPELVMSNGHRLPISYQAGQRLKDLLED